MLDIFRISDDTPMTEDKLSEYIAKNDKLTNEKYKPLWDAYNNDYAIFHLPKKPSWKPDNRLAVNFAQYITDTFEGFFLGIPVKVDAEDDSVLEYIKDFDDANDNDDVNAELSNIVSVFGRGYRLAYVDEYGDVEEVTLDPMESFAIYNDAIKPKLRYFVRTYVDSSDNHIRRGSISDAVCVRYFHTNAGKIVWDSEPMPHGFHGVPVVEFIQNRARKGIFEPVLPLIDAYNKALSEKCDDNEAFSESYLKVLGAKIDKDTLTFMRQNRVINVAGSQGQDVIVEFLQKPSNDGSQEHLLDRMERMIFTIAMVCNISDENFATGDSSGIAIKYKMLSMINLATKKWRKYEHSLKDFYRLVLSNPVNTFKEDDADTLTFVHTLNYPANIGDEAETAGKLSGITSKRTQLSILSIVDDVDEEMEQIKAEQEEDEAYNTDYETERVMTDEEPVEIADEAVQKASKSGKEPEA